MSISKAIQQKHIMS